MDGLTRRAFEEYWARLEADARAKQGSEEASLVLTSFYRELSSADQGVVDEVVAEWLLTGNPNQISDSLTLIGEFGIRGALPALRYRLAILGSATGPSAPAERDRVWLIIEDLDPGSPHEYAASLRITSVTLRLPDLIAVLGEPTDGYSIGDRTSLRLPESTRRRHTGWRLRSTLPQERDLEEHIAEVVTFFEEHRAGLESVRADVDVDIFCGIFSGDGAQGGFALDQDLLRRLVDLDVVVVFDLY
jgi:hypothetical protein